MDTRPACCLLPAWSQVREIWLSSEDTGAYGRDLGTNLPALLEAMLKLLPEDGRTMLRVGMTNPPYILEHLPEVARCLAHPACFAYLHIPVRGLPNWAGQGRTERAGRLAWARPVACMPEPSSLQH